MMQTRLNRLAKIMAGAIGGTLLCVSGVEASPILAVGALNDLNFNVSQNLVDNDGNGVASPGDYLYGIVNVTRISSNGVALWDAKNVPGPAIDSFSGYYIGTVATITPLPSPWAAIFTMAPASFDPNGVLSAADLAAHTMVKLFTDTMTPFETNGSVADDIAKATDGTLWGALGLDDGDWNGVVMQNGQVFAGGGLNFVSNFTGLNFATHQAPGCTTCPNVDLYFNTVATDNGLNQAWRYSGNNNGALRTVPEPSVAWLVVAGFLALGVTRFWNRGSNFINRC
ncbi:hypothetical protein [Sulfuricella sp. T08]|uniref:hypothetical protein n=1 Tax=Sulfuricella sp. T08 TaxID=1632857 RepID=UPI0007513B1B|nr:hypothetical protein [Sulfuricella sp. T08]